MLIPPLESGWFAAHTPTTPLPFTFALSYVDTITRHEILYLAYTISVAENLHFSCQTEVIAAHYTPPWTTSGASHSGYHQEPGAFPDTVTGRKPEP